MDKDLGRGDGRHTIKGQWYLLAGVMIGTCVSVVGFYFLSKDLIMSIPRGAITTQSVTEVHKTTGRLVQKQAKDQRIKLPVPKVPKSVKRAVYRPEVTFKYWKYVGPTPGYQDELVLPNIVEIHFMSLQESGALYHKYLNSLQVLCRKVERMGHLTDGGWDICLDQPYKLQNPCLVYSFG